MSGSWRRLVTLINNLTSWSFQYEHWNINWVEVGWCIYVHVSQLFNIHIAWHWTQERHWFQIKCFHTIPLLHSTLARKVTLRKIYFQEEFQYCRIREEGNTLNGKQNVNSRFWMARIIKFKTKPKKTPACQTFHQFSEYCSFSSPCPLNHAHLPRLLCSGRRHLHNVTRSPQIVSTWPCLTPQPRMTAACRVTSTRRTTSATYSTTLSYSNWCLGNGYWWIYWIDRFI